jgi:hypothetical protein
MIYTKLLMAQNRIKNPRIFLRSAAISPSLKAGLGRRFKVLTGYVLHDPYSFHLCIFFNSVNPFNSTTLFIVKY